jgi:phage repressor protein C with HTH and peptisase S24 domain
MTPAPAAIAQLVTETLREGRPVELRLLGRSMLPLIPPGSVLRIEPARADDVRLGEVVLVDLGGRHLCHRLVYVAGGLAVTRGDAVAECDPPLPADAIIGRVDVPPSPHALLCAVRALLR